MTGSSIGQIFKVTTWGESHGEALGCVIEGVPPNLKIDEDYIQSFLDRRKPGQSKFTTQRKEDDKIQILSGVFEGKTTGTPISMIIFNKDMRSRDYETIKNKFRPGHADYTYFKKYGLDYNKLKYAKKNAFVMHPGPMNRGVEIDSKLADDVTRSLIQEQVAMGVAVRMACLDLIIKNRDDFSK